MANSQAILFLLFALDGVIIGILFDFFRILRRSFSTGSLLTALEDIIFWIFTGIILLYSIFIYNNGIIRGYMFLGAFCGITLYMITLSSIFIKINVCILNFVKETVKTIVKIFSIPINIIIKLLKKMLITPIVFIFIRSRKNLRDIVKKSLNVLKKTKNIKLKKDFRKICRNK